MQKKSWLNLISLVILLLFAGLILFGRRYLSEVAYVISFVILGGFVFIRFALMFAKASFGKPGAASFGKAIRFSKGSGLSSSRFSSLMEKDLKNAHTATSLPEGAVPVVLPKFKLGDFFKLYDQIKSRKNLPGQMASGEKEGVSYQIYRMDLTIPGAPPFLQAKLVFSKAFPGRLILQRVDGPTIGQDVSLESLEFNKKTYIYTSRPEFAYQILSPDFMDWYLKMDDRPIILFDGQQCFYTVAENKPKSKEEILPVVEQLIDRVLHSGALA